MPKDRLAILFDIDGTLINTGGAGAASWRLAFDELYGVPADIGKFTDIGMTDPAVGRKTFEAVLKREPERREFTKLMERRNFVLDDRLSPGGHPSYHFYVNGWDVWGVTARILVQFLELAYDFEVNAS